MKLKKLIGTKMKGSIILKNNLVRFYFKRLESNNSTVDQCWIGSKNIENQLGFHGSSFRKFQ
jgi:hypothetical protein